MMNPGMETGEFIVRFYLTMTSGLSFQNLISEEYMYLEKK
jgi:hypothetical protein